MGAIVEAVFEGSSEFAASGRKAGAPRIPQDRNSGVRLHQAAVYSTYLYELENDGKRYNQHRPRDRALRLSELGAGSIRAGTWIRAINHPFPIPFTSG
jgi:hypothetical protein